LQSVTTTDSSGGSVTGTEGNKSVHQSVLPGFQEGDAYAVSNRDIGQSVAGQGTELNQPDAQGYTEIYRALKQDDKTRVESMLRDPSAKRLYIDYYPGDSDLTVRLILEQTYPDLKPYLPESLNESLDSSETDIKLLAALQCGDYGRFCENLNNRNLNHWYSEPYYSYLLEIACQMKDRKQFVELLLDKGADVNIKNRVTDMPLIHATARSGNLEVLQLLLEKKVINLKVKDKEDRTIFHWWARVSEKNLDDKGKLEKCFELLLRSKGFDKNKFFKVQDSSHSTPFSTAVDRGYSDRVTLMLDTKIDHDAWVHMNEILKSTKGPFVKSILEHCFESKTEEVNSEDLNVKFKVRAIKNMISYVRDSNHTELLKHPVLLAYINIMWNRLKYIFFFNVAFYVVFVAFLTAYILFSEFCNPQMNRGVASTTNELLSIDNNNLTCGMSDEWRYGTSQGLSYILMVLLGVLFFREVYQLYKDFVDYIKEPENWLELLLIFVTFTSCSGIVDSIEANKHLFAFAILLGWFELVLLLGRLPVLSVQTEMLKTISLTFLRFMAGYIILILAFAFSFYIIFKDNLEGDDVVLFANPLISVVKTVVMFAGEFDASGLPFDTLPGTSHLIFLLFVFFVAIVLLNLLNGLAVGDTKKVRKHAETLSLEARVNLIEYLIAVNSAIPDFIKSKKIKKSRAVFSKKTNIMGSTDLQRFQRIVNEQRERNKKQEETEPVENWNMFAEKLSALQTQGASLQKMLESVMNHFEIK